MKVIWQATDRNEEISHVDCATDFIQSLQILKSVTIEGEEFEVVDIEMVAEPEPCLVVALK